MKHEKRVELDCSKKCKHMVAEWEASGTQRNACENRYNDCVSKCAFA
jgi:hypothetical protein